MAKKKAKTKHKRQDDAEVTFLSYVKKQAPNLYERYASLQPFEDVINECWVNTQVGYVGIGIETGAGVWASGDRPRYYAEIHFDEVVLQFDVESGDETFRESYSTDMAGLWSFLRQIPRPMHSFGKWRPN